MSNRTSGRSNEGNRGVGQRGTPAQARGDKAAASGHTPWSIVGKEGKQV